MRQTDIPQGTAVLVPDFDGPRVKAVTISGRVQDAQGKWGYYCRTAEGQRLFIYTRYVRRVHLKEPAMKTITRTVKFRNAVLDVKFEPRDKKFGKAHFLGVATVPTLDSKVEVFSTPTGKLPFCARTRVKPGLYAHYFAATPGQAFASATQHL